ncbi:MAG: hypothetical protein V1904_12655 [Bacteroidota bacterium]
MKTFTTFTPEKSFSYMKKLLLFLFLTTSLQFIISNCFAQEKQPKLNISLGVSPPIKFEGMGKFFNEDWIYEAGFFNKAEDAGFLRKYNRINYLLNADYFLNENVFLRLSGGLTTRKIIEKKNVDYFFTDSTTMIQYHNIVRQNLYYNQINWNISVGIGSKIQSKKFSFYLGPELILIRYGKGKENGDGYASLNDLSTPQESIFTSSFTMEINGGFGAGIGLFAGADYNFTKNLKISFEVTEYYLYTFFDGVTVANTTNSTQNIPGTIVQNESLSYENTTLKQFVFSNIIPSFKIKYSFNKINHKY